jgi:hypothetical protein
MEKHAIFHKAHWTVRTLNMDLEAAGKQRKLHLSELDELRQDSYESSRICKDKKKMIHDRHILRREFFLENQFWCMTPDSTYFLGNSNQDGLALHCQESNAKWCSRSPESITRKLDCQWSASETLSGRGKYCGNRRGGFAESRAG